MRNGTPVPPEDVPTLRAAKRLPKEVEPMRVEPVYKLDGQVIRSTNSRHSSAICLDPNCPNMWDGASSTNAGPQHAKMTGHRVQLDYHVSYTLEINPRSRAARILAAADEAEEERLAQEEADRAAKASARRPTKTRARA